MNHKKKTISFNPQHKLFLVTGKLPRVKTNDKGFFKRLHLIPFKKIDIDAARFKTTE